MYKIKYTKNFEKSLKKLDKQTIRLIKNWILKNLEVTENPKNKGNPLKGNLLGIWRYRVGDYRIFAEIENEILTIFLIDIQHRSIIYKNWLNKS